jgi:alcohol dehydrogenase class IV
MWNFTSPTIIYGDDALDFLSELDGERCLIVTDSKLMELGYAETVADKLNMDCEVFNKVSPEPGRDVIQEGVRLAEEFKPSFIAGLGGGSCLDAAKLIFVLYEKPEIDITEISPFTKLGLRQKSKLICIPTTFSGSEASWAAVITEGDIKSEIASPELFPDYAVVDPYFVERIPVELISQTGLDALLNALESYVSLWRNNFSEALALYAFEIIFRTLPKAYSGDFEAIKEMQISSTIAGLAFSNSHVGVAHSLGHALGAEFKIPHGLATGVFLPYSIQFNFEHAKDRYTRLFESSGVNGGLKEIVEAVRNLMRSIDFPVSIKEMGIESSEFNRRLDSMVEKAEISTCNLANPRFPERNDLKELLMHAFEGRDVDF